VITTYYLRNKTPKHRRRYDEELGIGLARGWTTAAEHQQRYGLQQGKKTGRDVLIVTDEGRQSSPTSPARSLPLKTRSAVNNLSTGNKEKMLNHVARAVWSVFIALLIVNPHRVASQQNGMGNTGNGMGNGPGAGGGQGLNQGNSTEIIDAMMGSGEDRVIIQSLVNNREKIERNVTLDGAGVIAHTWSEDAEVAEWIKTHVAAMKARVEGGDPIRLGDPLFEAVFNRASELVLDVEYLSEGVIVHENGTTPCAQALVQAHAEVVTGFIERGQNETMSKHDVPKVCLATNDSGAAFVTKRADPIALVIAATAAALAFHMCQHVV
jgi:hypothetical protein